VRVTGATRSLSRSVPASGMPQGLQVRYKADNDWKENASEMPRHHRETLVRWQPREFSVIKAAKQRE
jgi:hypothetical protein